jgi:hypothetical protein
VKIIKVFDEYINLEKMSSIFIEKNPEENDLWDVCLYMQYEAFLEHRWIGSFESREAAVIAVENLLSSFGANVGEFIPDLN